MDAWLTNLNRNHLETTAEKNSQISGINATQAQNVVRDVGIKIVIFVNDDKMQPETFMSWIVHAENFFPQKPVADGHKVTLVATRSCGQVGRQNYNDEAGSKLWTGGNTDRNEESDETEIT